MIYILLEDDGFSLKTYSISICLTNTNPNSPPKSVLFNCSNFDQIPLYGAQTYSNIKKYCFGISKSHYPYVFRSNNYTVIYYDGSESSGDLYVTADDSNLLINDAAEALSTVAIVFIVIGSIIVIAVAIVISACCCACCACCRRSQPGIMPITQPAAYIAPNPVTYGATMPLQPPGVYSPY